jgi:non-specific serine/threonine protein kinase/serine/threonine-protein kinase
MADDDHTPPADPEKSTESTVGPPGTPERIGPYKVLQTLGEGGMGIVYLAEQEKPIRRRVALKVIKLGMDTKQVIARFEAERQALAIMNHPNLAKVFDAGATEQGRPYFAMEYVKGVPITEHCDRHKLPTIERLRLFRQVCDGVQHAHHKGIIHRDLKPSNILVSIEADKAVPKIIDFGVAKATEHRLTERTVFTEIGVMIGTPEYMSPEQASLTEQDIDTRTDVYSLGVVLYELLVGALPLDPKDLRSAGLDEIRRRILEEEPSKPSARLRTLGDASKDSAARRRTDLRSLARQLHGDLDWVTMKALEKDRARRYGSPSELAADLGRHLQHQAVLAGPPTVPYRATKFVRRHRIGVGSAALLLTILVAFSVTTTVQSRRIAREAETSKRVSEFLADMLADVDPEALGQLLMEDLREQVQTVQRKHGETVEQSEAMLASFDVAMRGVNTTDTGLRLLDELVLARAGDAIEQGLAEKPRIAARLELTIGQTYRKLGLLEQAETHLRRAVETRQQVLGDGHQETLRTMNSLALVCQLQGRYDEAERIFVELLETSKRVLGDHHHNTLTTMHNLATVYEDRGHHEQAEPLYLEVLETSKRVNGDDHPDTISFLSNLALFYLTRGRYEEAEKLSLEALAAKRRILGHDDPNTLKSMNTLALLYKSQGRYDEAEPLFVEVLETHERLRGRDHPDTLSYTNNLALLYQEQGRYSEAEPLFVETLDARRRVLGRDHPRTFKSMNNLAILCSLQGRDEEAGSLFAETLDARKRVLGDDHPETLKSINNLAYFYSEHQRYGEAEPLFAKVLDTRERVLGERHPYTASSMYNLALVHLNQRRYDEAEPLFLRALATQERVLGEGHPTTLRSAYAMARLEAVRGDAVKAKRWLRQTVDAGYSNAAGMVEDSDLEPLHGPEFDALVEHARNNAVAQRTK